MQSKSYEVQGILYDLGGILVCSGELPTLVVTDYLGLSKDEAKRIWAKNVEAFFTRKITEKKWWSAFIKESSKITTPEYVMKKFRDSFYGYDSNLKLARRIKTSGKYKTAILTDSPVEWLEYLEKRFDLNSCVDMVLSSQESGFIKSNPEAFRYALQKFGTIPEKTIFIDDVEEYVNVSRSAGLIGLHSKTPEDVPKLLMGAGVKV